MILAIVLKKSFHKKKFSSFFLRLVFGPGRAPFLDPPLVGSEVPPHRAPSSFSPRRRLLQVAGAPQPSYGTAGKHTHRGEFIRTKTTSSQRAGRGKGWETSWWRLASPARHVSATSSIAGDAGRPPVCTHNANVVLGRAGGAGVPGAAQHLLPRHRYGSPPSDFLSSNSDAVPNNSKMYRHLPKEMSVAQEALPQPQPSQVDGGGVAQTRDAVRNRGVLGTATARVGVPRLLLRQLSSITCTYTGGNLPELPVLDLPPF